MLIMALAGVWGPYYSALLPELWLNEGGQSAAGAAIDQLVRMHPASAAHTATAKEHGRSLFEFLETRILVACSASEAARLARDVHVLPDFLGNRSPHADPDARAAIVGLGIDADLASLERLYVAAVCALGYCTEEVICALRKAGVRCDMLVMSGGMSNSPLVRQLMADASGLPVGVPHTAEPVLLGSAMLGAVAGTRFATLNDAMQSMSRMAAVVEPSPSLVQFHASKRKVFAMLRGLESSARDVMKGV